MKWGIAAVVGVLLAYPVNLLMQCVAQLAVGSDSIWWGYALSALTFIFYLLLGMFLASLQNLRASGAGRRFRWPEFALGMFLFVMSVVMKLEQATGLVAAAGFVRSSEILTQIVTFDDSLHLWVVLAGFFMTHAFERVSEESMARAAALRAQAAQARIARKNARKNGRKTSAKSAEPTAAPPVAAQPGAEPTAAPPVAAQPGAQPTATPPIAAQPDAAEASPTEAAQPDAQPTAAPPIAAQPSAQPTATPPIAAQPDAAEASPTEDPGPSDPASCGGGCRIIR